MVGTLIFLYLKGMASGNLVKAHMIVNRYWLPDYVSRERSYTILYNPTERFIC